MRYIKLLLWSLVLKKILKYKKVENYVPLEYVNSISFQVKGLFGKAKILNSYREWISHLQKFNYKDIKVYIKSDIEDPSLLGLLNTHESKIIFQFLNGKGFSYTPMWSFDNTINKWNIRYIEEKIDYPESYDDGSLFDIEKFDNLLGQIAIFAEEIGSEYFSKIFKDARWTLHREDLPGKYDHILYAIYLSDVFAGRGSWNDEPMALAGKKNLSDKFISLSKDLVKQTRLGAMYCTNDW